MSSLLLLGLNHSTAPLEVRENLALSDPQQRQALCAVGERFVGCEAVLLNTCNRVELYLGGEPGTLPPVDHVIQFLGELQHQPGERFREHLYQKRDEQVVRHLFSVACSLDSMVVGETQIIGQVRQAYERSRALGQARGVLHPLFQRAAAVARQVQRDTGLCEGRHSVAGVAVDYARRIFDHFHDKTVLCVGAGKMVFLVLQQFVQLKPGRLIVCNRDPVKAQSLAERFGGSGAGIDMLDDQLTAADVVITSTGASRPLITRPAFEQILRRRRYRPIFMIDIAVPRDVDPSVGDLDHVYLYNLDDLQRAVDATHSRRSEAIAQARRIVDENVQQFMAWSRGRAMGPVIDRLYTRSHELASRELEKILSRMPDLSEARKDELRRATRQIVNKLLHDPVQRLRDGQSIHGGPNVYVHALEKLFRLDADASQALTDTSQREESP